MEDTEPICERCIWSLDHGGLSRAAPCDPQSWAGSVQKELLANGLAPDLSGEAGPHPAYLRCAAIMMVKDEADIIGHNLRWLYHIGVRRFAVMDNMSTDGTRAEIARFEADRPDALLLVIEDTAVAYLQAEKTTAMAQMARSHFPDVDWILPIDADEFCIARHGVRALAYVPADVLALTIPKTIHFLPEGETGSDEANPMARMTVRSALFVVPPKIILRAHPALHITQGNHKADRWDGEAIPYAGGFQWGFYHREFQTRSFAHFLRKVRNGGVAILAARAAKRHIGGEHWVAWYEVLCREGEEGLRKVFARECLRAPGGGFVIDAFRGA
jgi:hypothetical protein